MPGWVKKIWRGFKFYNQNLTFKPKSKEPLLTQKSRMPLSKVNNITFENARLRQLRAAGTSAGGARARRRCTGAAKE